MCALMEDLDALGPIEVYDESTGTTSLLGDLVLADALALSYAPPPRQGFEVVEVTMADLLAYA